MSEENSTTNYRHDQWNVEFSHPENWEVQEDTNQSDYPLQVCSDGKDESSAQVAFKMIEASDGTVESLLKALAEEVGQDLTTKVLNQDVKTLKQSGKRGMLLFQQEREEGATIVQQVIYPLENGSFLFFRATSLESFWPEHQKSFADIMRSVHYFNPGDVEIEFGDALHIPKQTPGSSAGVEISHTAPKEISEISFEDFAAQYDSTWKMCSRKLELMEICGEESIAKAIWAGAGVTALDWITDQNLALGGKTPKQCFTSAAGISELKALLMQLNEEGTNLREITQRHALEPEDNNESLHNLQRLFEVTDAYRNTPEWNKEFYQLTAKTSFYVADSPLVQDPHGLAYYSIHTELPPNGESMRQRSLPETINEITQLGVGLIIDPQRVDPNGPVIFGFGAMWGFRESGSFIDTYNSSFLPNSVPKAPPILMPATQKIVPEFARCHLREVLQQGVGMTRPTVMVQSTPGEAVEFSLIFNLFDYTQDEGEVHGIVDILSWYIKPGYGIGACSTNAESQSYLVTL